MTDGNSAEEIERMLLRIVHILGKRNLGKLMERRLEGLVDFSHVAIVDALNSETSAIEATVGQIGKWIGQDHTRASRMVAGTIKAGYARRVASQEDGRRTCVSLTEKGQAFAAAIRNVRHKFFLAHLKGWSEEDLRTFARLLTRFAHGFKQERAQRDRSAIPPTDNVVVLRPGRERKKRKRQRRANA